MSDERRTLPPSTRRYKTDDGRPGGLVRLPLEGGLHDGRELFIDEPDVPSEIFTTSASEPFEWWPRDLRETMARQRSAAIRSAPPIRYVLNVDDDTREPRFVAEPEH